MSDFNIPTQDYHVRSFTNSNDMAIWHLLKMPSSVYGISDSERLYFCMPFWQDY